MIRSRVLAVAALLALAATPAFAYVNTGNLVESDGPNAPSTGYATGNFGHVTPSAIPINRNQPSHPVPEPGTMAMASMGLMALGAHLKKRNRGR
jgi:hypothetical protein